MIVRMPSRRQRVALVTGSSRGLGSAIARRLAQDGLAVAVNGLHDDAQALAVVEAIESAGGVAAAFPADVTDERQSVELVAAVTERLGPVDVLVVNATGPQPEAPLMEVSWDDHVAQLDFFVKSPVLLGRARASRDAVPALGAHHPDRLRGRRPAAAGQICLREREDAQIGLSRSWARELAPAGITVNTVAPGFVPVERHADVPAETRSAYLASVPAGRMGTPDDIAHAVSFFASEAAGFVTGQRLVVDGGRGLG